MLTRIQQFIRRRSAYRDIFNADDPVSRIVLADLKRFCKHNKSTFNTDPLMQSYLNGRRDVLERIFSFTNLTEDQINRMTEDSNHHE